MPKRQSRETEYLFNLYSKNLTFNFPNYQDIFVCPLCSRGFHRNAIQEHKIDRAHVIPESIGGKIKTLACTECNNRNGVQLDHEIASWVNSEDIFAGKSERSLRGIITTDNGKETADVYISKADKPIFTIIRLPEHSHPETLKDVENKFEHGIKAFSLHLDLGYGEAPLRVATLSSAYLMMFLYFGYGYIKYSFLEQIRQQIMHPETATEILNGVFRLNSPPPAKNSVAILNDNCHNFRSFVALLDFSTKEERYFGVILLGFDQDSKTTYERFSVLRRERPMCEEAHLRIIPRNLQYVSDVKFANACRALWERVKN